MKGKEEIRTVIVCEVSTIYRLYASSRNRQPLTKSWQCKKLWLTNSEPQEERANKYRLEAFDSWIFSN